MTEEETNRLVHVAAATLCVGYVLGRIKATKLIEQNRKVAKKLRNDRKLINEFAGWLNDQATSDPDRNKFVREWNEKLTFIDMAIKTDM
jgi:hypothetical protein